MKLDQCPRCGSCYIAREHKRDGKTTCSNCDLSLTHDAWKQLKMKLAGGKSNLLFDLKQPPLNENEAAAVASRKEELWSRLERFGDELVDPGKMKEVRNTILQYIAELEMKKEIPVGLTVEAIAPNTKRYDKDKQGNDHPMKGELMFPGHIVVKFNLADDCPKENREALIPFLGGRKSLL